MKRLATMTLVICSLASWSWDRVGAVTVAEAATVTDTFQLKLTGKRWCEDNPKFSETFTVKIDPNNPGNNAILTITRTGDLTNVQATIKTHGLSDDLDATPLKGEAFFTNKSGRRVEFVLSGVNPGNTKHFVTIRGQATLDNLGNLTKVTGSFTLRETHTYTVDSKTGVQSAPVECFNSGTFVTNQKLPSSGGGGGGGGGGGAGILRINNRSHYSIIDLRLNGTELISYPGGIAAGTSFDIPNLSPGTIPYVLGSGWYNNQAPLVLFASSGSTTVTEGQITTVTFQRETLGQLLTCFQAVQDWKGNYWHNLEPHTAVFRFFQNGSWTFFDDGVNKGSGTTVLVFWNDNDTSVHFRHCSSCEETFLNYDLTDGTLWAHFFLHNGPADWPQIEYVRQLTGGTGWCQ